MQVKNIFYSIEWIKFHKHSTSDASRHHSKTTTHSQPLHQCTRVVHERVSVSDNLPIPNIYIIVVLPEVSIDQMWIPTEGLKPM